MYVWTVAYQVATYSGEVTVTSSEDLENHQVEARAKDQLRRRSASMPFGVCTFKVKGKRSESSTLGEYMGDDWDFMYRTERSES